jgi:UDP-N-acetylglucosamine diphosphorylase/glucosamine-1-phosphate N-acetyltransferase
MTTSPHASTSAHATPASKPGAIILAAGKGTRMRSDLPKVCFPVGGREMVCAVVDACIAAGCGRIVVIVGYQQERVRAALASYPAVEFAVQAEQLGTGHAVMSAASLFAPGSTNIPTNTFVLCGDGPLIRAATLRDLHTAHSKANASATLATAVIDNPDGYGRIDRDAAGRFRAIVEQKNATPAQLAIREVNPSYYLFKTAALFDALRGVTRNELTGEYYLTDTLGHLLAAGHRVEVLASVPPEDILSINTPEDLAKVDAIYRSRTSQPTAPRSTH